MDDDADDVTSEICATKFPLNVPAFLTKLWQIVDSPETNKIVTWSGDGNSIVILDEIEFTHSLLPYYYKHSNMPSFVRQLNLYGFRKIATPHSGSLKVGRSNTSRLQFSHPRFVRNQPSLLSQIKRKHPGSIGDVVPYGMSSDTVLKLQSDVAALVARQPETDRQLQIVMKENQALWQELMNLRKQHQTQQHVMNKLVQFFISMVKPHMMKSGRVNASTSNTSFADNRLSSTAGVSGVGSQLAIVHQPPTPPQGSALSNGGDGVVERLGAESEVPQHQSSLPPTSHHPHQYLTLTRDIPTGTPVVVRDPHTGETRSVYLVQPPPEHQTLPQPTSPMMITHDRRMSVDGANRLNGHSMPVVNATSATANNSLASSAGNGDASITAVSGASDVIDILDLIDDDESDVSTNQLSTTSTCLHDANASAPNLDGLDVNFIDQLKAVFHQHGGPELAAAAVAAVASTDNGGSGGSNSTGDQNNSNAQHASPQFAFDPQVFNSFVSSLDGGHFLSTSSSSDRSAAAEESLIDGGTLSDIFLSPSPSRQPHRLGIELEANGNEPERQAPNADGGDTLTNDVPDTTIDDDVGFVTKLLSSASSPALLQDDLEWHAD